MTRLKLPTFAVLILITVFIAPAVSANDYGAVRGVVHDPQHRPIQNAMVMLKAKSSDWAKSVTTGANGEFQFNAVALGEYSVSVASQGFAQTSQDVTVISGSVPVVHFQLQVASANEKVLVSGAPAVVATDSFTPTTLVNRLDIERTPGADQTNSMAMITDYVPAAYVTHDMLHMRGGHQITWLLDGIPIINTAIAQNLGPQFDPKDLEYVEVNRGSYGAEFGDRTYGVFNVVPRTGFERNNEGELVMTAGNFYQTDDPLSFGSHTDRFAYYASVNANRSNLGLQPPVPQVVHDAVNGVGGFGSFILNVDPANQLRLMTSVRRDYYQIPYDPNPNDIENQLYPSYGLRDGQTEVDTGVLFTWLHTFNSHLLTTVSPFYHYNSGDYASNPNDIPIATTENRASTYVGGQASFAANYKKNDLQVGFLSFYQHDNQVFGAIFNDGSGNPPFTIGETPDRQSRDLLHRRQIQSFSLADSIRRHAPHAVLRRQLFGRFSRAAHLRVRHQPTLRRHRHRSSHCVGHSAPSTDTTIKRRPSKPFPVSWNPCVPSPRMRASFCRSTVSATKNISSASPSLTADGSSTPIPSKPMSPIFSTTTTSALPTSSFPSPIPGP